MLIENGGYHYSYFYDNNDIINTIIYNTYNISLYNELIKYFALHCDYNTLKRKHFSESGV